MFGKDCEGCAMRDVTIADLREQLREAHKTALSVIDSKAYAIRYAAERSAQREERQSSDARASSPAEIRGRTYRPQLTSEEIERSFAAEAAAAQGGAGSTGTPERDS
jgi:hypothetical protein